MEARKFKSTLSILLFSISRFEAPEKACSLDLEAERGASMWSCLGLGCGSQKNAEFLSQKLWVRFVPALIVWPVRSVRRTSVNDCCALTPAPLLLSRGPA